MIHLNQRSVPYIVYLYVNHMMYTRCVCTSLDVDKHGKSVKINWEFNGETELRLMWITWNIQAQQICDFSLPFFFFLTQANMCSTDVYSHSKCTSHVCKLISYSFLCRHVDTKLCNGFTRHIHVKIHSNKVIHLMCSLRTEMVHLINITMVDMCFTICFDGGHICYSFHRQSC